jgi:ATP/maltotriose-dependent transcriptional regulator MalT
LVLVFGPTDTEETVRRCDDLLQRFPERGQLQAFALVSRGMSLGMRGEFEEAHSSMARGRSMLQDLGMLVSWGATSFVSATIDLRRDPAGAERELRGGYEVLERMGETGFLSTVAAFLAEALYQQGRGEEAEAMTVASETLAPSDDLASQAIWRTVRAKLLAGRGKFDQADVLSREAVEMLDPTDWLFEKGLTQLAHAEVHLMAHRDDQAVTMLLRARETFELKGATLWAATVRALENERSN